METNYKELDTNHMISKIVRFNIDNLEANINNYYIQHKNDYTGNLSLSVKSFADETIDMIFTWSTFKQEKEYEIIGVKLVPTYRYETINTLKQVKDTYRDEVNIDIIARFFKNNFDSDILLLISAPKEKTNNNELAPKTLVR